MRGAVRLRVCTTNSYAHAHLRSRGSWNPMLCSVVSFSSLFHSIKFVPHLYSLLALLLRHCGRLHKRAQRPLSCYSNTTPSILDLGNSGKNLKIKFAFSITSCTPQEAPRLHIELDFGRPHLDCRYFISFHTFLNPSLHFCPHSAYFIPSCILHSTPTLTLYPLHLLIYFTTLLNLSELPLSNRRTRYKTDNHGLGS